MSRVTIARVEQILSRLSDEQNYQIGYRVDGPWREYIDYCRSVGLTDDEAKEIKRYLNYRV